MNKYYNLTVIPSIVLGYLTTIGLMVSNGIQFGDPTASIGEAVFSFIFFLTVITANEFSWKK